jgi:CrcB protein
MRDLLLVAAGGAVGAMTRYGVGLLAAQLPGKPLPLATLSVNVVGCFLIGVAGQYLLVAESAASGGDSSSGWIELVRHGLVIGFLGGLTTFSAFGWDTAALFQKGHAGLALANVAANVLVGLIAVWLGMALMRTMQ